MIRAIKKHWPLIVGIGTLWIVTIIVLAIGIRKNHGHFTYVLDDPYIHMAMAKNFAQCGVLGITNRGFTSASSSPLWTLLLSLVYFLFGVNEISPFILNIILGSFIVFFTYVFLRKDNLNSLSIFTALLSIVFFTPLPAMIFIGMEHTLHILITLTFVYLSSKMLSKETWTVSESSLLLLLAFFLPMARYEGLFLILVVVVLFVLKRRPYYSFLLLCTAILPIAIYGLISVLHGWFFLPNSILLKGNIPELSLTGIGTFLYAVAAKIKRKEIIGIMFALLLITFIFQQAMRTDLKSAPIPSQKQKTFWKNSIVMFTIFFAMVFLHLLFADLGLFYRYEAYIVATGILAISIAIHENLSKVPSNIKLSKQANSLIIALLILPLLLPLLKRGTNSLRKIPQAATNIYEQQYQMGLFLRQFYTGESVAANDIGAINYLAPINCLDLWGLASLEVAEAKRNRCYNTQKIYDLARQKKVKLAIVYDSWFKSYGGIPPQWVRCGQWKISDNTICGDDKVLFYAVNPSEANNLKNNLSAFSSHLPKSVVQMGAYRGCGMQNNS